MEHDLDRRTFVLGAFAGAGALALGQDPTAAQTRRALARSAAFRQGVASGFPRPRAISLWTRIEDIVPRARSRDAFVELEVARDRGFRRVVERRLVSAGPEADFTVHAQVGGLDPREEYFYRFSTRATSSAVGRFRTPAPAGSREPVRIAFFSCQDFTDGFYHAHADLARQDDVDLVVCLGDYMYERASRDNPNQVRRDRSAPDGETQTLADYRAKYALYHSDRDLREVRRRFPLVAVWDDHEVENNYAGPRPGRADDDIERRVSFRQRKRNGYRAWFEHMPRGLQAGRSPRIYGSLPLGNAEVFLLDTRQYRSDAPRALVGRSQRAWLERGLARSRATWKVVANQVMFMSLDTAPGRLLNPDAWDGYVDERREIVDFIARRGIDDVTFVTGDIHIFFAGDVSRTGRLRPGNREDGRARATEFVGGSITSPGVVDRDPRAREAARVRAAAPLDRVFRTNNPHMAYSNNAYKGYGILEARRDRLEVEFRAVRETRVPRTSAFTLRRFEVRSGRPEVIDRGR